jgi:hypothetical protein
MAKFRTRQPTADPGSSFAGGAGHLAPFIEAEGGTASGPGQPG